MAVNRSTWEKRIFETCKAFVENPTHQYETSVLEAGLVLCPWHFTTWICLWHVRPTPDLQVTWDLITTSYRRLVLQTFFSSNLKVTRVSTVTKYVILQQVWEIIWRCMEVMSRERQVNLFITYVIKLARMRSYGYSLRIKEMVFC